MAASIESLLKLLLVPDNNVILQATSQLREAFKNPAIIEALVSVLSTSENIQIRQYAAVLLRRKFSRRKQWAKNDENVKQGLKGSLLQILIREPEKIVKNAIAQVIGVIAKHDLPKGQWPELLQFLNNLSNSNNILEKEIGLFTLSIVSSVAAVQLKPYLSGLLALFTKTLQEPNQNVPFFTIQVLTNLASTVGTDELGKFQSLIPSVMNVICTVLVSNEEQMSESLDLFEELMDCEVAIIVPYVKPLVEMCLKITTNSGLQDNTRVKAMSVIYKIIRLKKKSIVKHKLISPIVDVLFPIMCAPTSQDLDTDVSGCDDDNEEDDEDDDQSPVSFAPQVLNIMALHLPPEKLMVPLLRHLEPALLSTNPYPRKAGYLTIAVLAEGCSENIRSKYLQSFLQVICKGISDPSPVVKNYALFALGQFAEYLQPDVCSYHSEIMPLLFDYLTRTCQQLQQSGKDPPNMTRTFYAMETYCESLGDLLIPYLPDFMKCILIFLSDTQSISAKELAISAIGSAANATKEAMVPYFPVVIDFLKPYLAEQQSESALLLQIQSIDTLGVLGRTIGANNFLPMAHDSVKMGLSLIENAQDPDLRRSVYGLFASVSSVLKGGMDQYMASIIRLMLHSLMSTEGIVPQYDEANGAFMLLDESEEEEEESPEDEDISVDNQEGSDDDDDVVGFNVENSYLEEKEDTCWALKEIASNVGQSFLPYFEPCFEQIKKLIDHPDTDVRKASLVTLGHFCIVLHKAACEINSAQGQQAFMQSIGIYLPKLICTCREDTELEVVSAGVETLNELLKEAKQDMLDASSIEAIVRLIQDTFAQKLSCQDESEVKEDEQEAEYDSLLIEFVGELIPTLTKILPHEQFMPYLQTLIARLIAKANPKNSVSDKSFSMGTLAEIVEAIGPTGGLIPLVPTLEPIFLKGMKDEDEEVRSNSVFGLGLMVQGGGDALVPHYPTLLQALSTMLTKENNPRAKDNICGAVARFIMTKTEAVPIKEVFPVLLQCLPLREDFEENLTVYKCIHQLYTQRHEMVAQNLTAILRIISTAINATTTDDESKRLLVEVTKAAVQDFPKDFENILTVLTPEKQQTLRSVIGL